MDSSSADDTHRRIANSTDTIRAGMVRAARSLGDSVQALATKTDVRNRVQQQAAGVRGRLPDLARKAAGQAATLGRKYPVRLVTAVAAALAGIIAGRRRGSR